MQSISAGSWGSCPKEGGGTRLRWNARTKMRELYILEKTPARAREVQLKRVSLPRNVLGVPLPGGKTKWWGAKEGKDRGA